MVGNSRVMFGVFEQIRRFAACDMPVLIIGESGTGKELVARAIHDRSRRASGPFVAINCAAVPATLIASELFGYEKGAFTGASVRKHGLIERANKGTLFLDEIGDMPTDLQGHLLRFLQEGEIVRVGGHEPIKVDLRVVAATNVRLRDAIAAGRFREDLYYRLNVLSLLLPPLRERDGDVEILAAYFLRQIGQELGRPLRGFTPEAAALLRAHNWPGNVRELIAILRRAAVLANGEQITAADLRLEKDVHIARHPAGAEPWDHRPMRLIRSHAGSTEEREAVMASLQEHGFNITAASRALGVSRVTFYRMLQRNHIELRQQCVIHNEVTDPAHT
ncbi:MAG: sigma-54-dependent Fis family transcriptional regulator [Rhodospirillales bacterium]|nr:sigma-54-dependent Fis family transcriptional regulator [Rhodospirillales bacterium]